MIESLYTDVDENCEPSLRPRRNSEKALHCAKPKDSNPLLNIPSAADYLEISPKALRRAIREDQLKHYRASTPRSRVYLLLSDLERWYREKYIPAQIAGRRRRPRPLWPPSEVENLETVP